MSAATTAIGSKFDYVIYIRTTAEKLWDALTKPEFTKQYWCGTEQKSDFKTGSPWCIVVPNGGAADTGEVLEAKPPHKLVLKWQNQLQAEMTAEGHSRATIEIEKAFDDMVKLTVRHEMEIANSKFIGAVSKGWPVILSSLKTLLETGHSFEEMRKMPDKF